MQLLYIKEEKCSCCRAEPKEERVGGWHAHKECGRTEERTFECGRRLAYVPNFRRVEVRTECPQNPAEKEKTEKRNEALTRMKSYVNRLDVDQEFKDALKRQLNNIYV